MRATFITIAAAAVAFAAVTFVAAPASAEPVRVTCKLVPGGMHCKGSGLDYPFYADNPVEFAKAFRRIVGGDSGPCDRYESRGHTECTPSKLVDAGGARAQQQSNTPRSSNQSFERSTNR